ncbi:hypothetical protein AKO1_007194, partial [Acrasis kona]
MEGPHDQAQILYNHHRQKIKGFTSTILQNLESQSSEHQFSIYNNLLEKFINGTELINNIFHYLNMNTETKNRSELHSIKITHWNIWNEVIYNPLKTRLLDCFWNMIEKDERNNTFTGEVKQFSDQMYLLSEDLYHSDLETKLISQASEFYKVIFIFVMIVQVLGIHYKSS